MFDGPITDDKQHEEALARLEALWGAEPGTPEAAELDRLADLIHAYEAAHLDELLPQSDPGALIDAKRAELGISQRELARRLGWPSGRTSEVIRGKRDLTLRMVRDLVETLGMDAHTLIRADLPEGALMLRGEALALLDRLAQRDRVPREIVVARALTCYAYAAPVPRGGGGTWFGSTGSGPTSTTLRLVDTPAAA